MRVALLYPPPWKLSEPGQADVAGADGPPLDYRPGDLDPDFHQIPYGLLSLGAQAARAGHQVKVYNLSAFSWPRVEEVVRALGADVFGMSCWTANRRGVHLVANEIRRHHPRFGFAEPISAAGILAGAVLSNVGIDPRLQLLAYDHRKANAG